MANLVNIVLDKDSGNLYASSTPIGGGSPPGSGAVGFSYTQSIGATVWTVVHSLNTTDVLYQLYDSTLEQIIPDSFSIIDPDTVEVTFSVPQTGFLKLITF